MDLKAGDLVDLTPKQGQEHYPTFHEILIAEIGEQHYYIKHTKNKNERITEFSKKSLHNIYNITKSIKYNHHWK